MLKKCFASIYYSWVNCSWQNEFQLPGRSDYYYSGWVGGVGDLENKANSARWGLTELGKNNTSLCFLIFSRMENIRCSLSLTIDQISLIILDT